MTEEIFRSIEAAECVEWIWCDVVRKLLTFDILIFWSHCRMCADLRWEQTIISALAPERMLSSAFGATHEIFAKSLSPLLRQTRNSVSTEIRRNYYSSHLWISSEICGRSHKTAQMVRWDSPVEITLILFADCGRLYRKSAFSPASIRSQLKAFIGVSGCAKYLAHFFFLTLST